MSTESKGTAIVTGASSGIGEVYAQRLADRGYDLILVARRLDRLEALGRKITERTGRKVQALQADLTSRATWPRSRHCWPTTARSPCW